MSVGHMQRLLTSGIAMAAAMGLPVGHDAVQPSTASVDQPAGLSSNIISLLASAEDEVAKANQSPYDAARSVAIAEPGSHLHRVSKAVMRYSVVLASEAYETIPSYWLALGMVTCVVVAFMLCW